MATAKKKVTVIEDDRNVPLELLQELYRSYDFFNDYFCDGKLPRPMLIVSSNFNRNAQGWFGPGSWKMKGKEVSEITLCGESFEQGTDEVLETLLHEMAHLKNYYDNECEVVDCTPQQRHNKIFKHTAEFFGLIVSQYKHLGYAHTQNGPESLKAIKALKPKEELYDLYRAMKPKKDEDKKKSKLKPVMIDEDTKQLIVTAAEHLGITQKELVDQSVNLLLTLPERVTSISLELFNNIKKFKSVQEISEFILSGLKEPSRVVESEG
jgi:hypothetical protein